MQGIAGRIVLRSIGYPEGPYLAWYVYDESDPEGEVTLVRLFHTSQDRPTPNPARWSAPS